MALTVIQGYSKHSNFGQKFLMNQLGLPPRKPLPGFPEAGVLPHCFVGEEAFPLSVDLMRPYPRGQRGIKLSEDQLVFNYRLSRARRNCGMCFWHFGTVLQSF